MHFSLISMLRAVIPLLLPICASPIEQHLWESRASNGNSITDTAIPSFGIPGKNASFDYVVIGGGNAGLVVATRLAQQPNTSVAVIEAGNFYEIDNGNLSVIPADGVFYAGSSPTDVNPLVDWGFVSTPQAGLNNRSLHYARGKCLGGSSGRNYFTYHRGTKESYRKWALEVDDKSYEFDLFLPYFKKSVDFTPPNNAARPSNASVSYNHDSFNTGSGPLKVSIPIWANAFSSFAKLAFGVLGLKSELDFVSGTLCGVQYNMNTIDPKDQTRSSSESSFLRMAEDIASLKIYNGTLAKRIVFDGNKASGVTASTKGVEYTLFASQEVVLSAGAFQSPQLLMVSGVGPEPILSQHNIPIISALPGVGQNMWDHYIFSASYQVNVITHSAVNNASYLARSTEDYLKDGSGLLGNPGGDLIGWEKLPYPYRNSLTHATRQSLSTFPEDWPEIEYLILDAFSGNNENYIANAPRTPYMYASPAAALVAPLSRGNITISSTNMADPPIINPNWLSHPADQDLAIAAFKRVRQLMNTDIMRSITVGSEVFPGLNVSSDAQILDHIKNDGTMVFHASGTCKMGVVGDPMAVVDSKARVFGTTRLRIVDAAAFPFLPPGHPQSTIYALAEKIADDIISARI
ncbi:Dehydrogenase patE [Lachnellula arida]|uniref:Dehydrogenase patE n=1 Tax=Lachnellula arida TaxID=1316785 RepID=A0A8T9BHY4_9HELO|nr:Dehydrogenase patE [Lachnellula arida]